MSGLRLRVDAWGLVLESAAGSSQVRQFLNGHRIPGRGPNDSCRPPTIQSGCADNFGWTKLDKTVNDFSRAPKII